MTVRLLSQPGETQAFRSTAVVMSRNKSFKRFYCSDKSLNWNKRPQVFVCVNYPDDTKGLIQKCLKSVVLFVLLFDYST